MISHEFREHSKFVETNCSFLWQRIVFIQIEARSIQWQHKWKTDSNALRLCHFYLFNHCWITIERKTAWQTMPRWFACAYTIEKVCLSAVNLIVCLLKQMKATLIPNDNKHACTCTMRLILFFVHWITTADSNEIGFVAVVSLTQTYKTKNVSTGC